jgi:membrane associated rhomboid family serine protease
MRRLPVVNWALIGMTVFLFFGSPRTTDGWVLSGWSLEELVGYQFLHAGLIHLIGNMLFLWVFGNAVCAKVGHVAFAPIYLALGIAAGAVHLMVDGTPAIGASGAINGIVGMFLFWYPRNSISCIWLFVAVGAVRFSSYWAILIWLAFDLWGAATGAQGVAYFAHIGGFAVGFLLAMAISVSGVLEDSPYEQSLLDLYRGR